MKCPKCKHPKSEVYDTKRTQDGSKVIRRRLCRSKSCGHKWETMEASARRSWSYI